MDGSESDASANEHSLSSLSSLEDDAFFFLERPEMIQEEDQDNSAGAESGGADCEVLNGSRQRKCVDYIKLNDVSALISSQGVKYNWS